MQLHPASGRQFVTQRYWPIAFLLLLGNALAAPATSGGLLELRVHDKAQGSLQLNRLGAVVDAKRRPLAVTRLDLLLSDFELQRPDGTWTTSPGWHAFFRAEPGAARQPLPVLAPGTYRSARVTVGVAPEANHADPNRLKPDDPLHPVVNGLHWGWKGGYVFMALEGHWQFDQAPRGSTGGFSYHLAGDQNRVTVPLPGPVTVGPGAVLRLTLDANRLLAKVNIAKDGDATHSREQDALVQALSSALAGAMKLQTLAGVGAATARAPGTSNSSRSRSQSSTEPYTLAIAKHMPTVALPEDNPLTVAGVALGALLFNDRRLSRDASLACASCHHTQHALADAGKALSAGVGGRLGQRNAMPLFNLAWAQEFFWDGRIKGLRQQVLDPIQQPHEMAASLPQVVARLAADKALAERFNQAFGGPVTSTRIAMALEQFLLTQVAQDAKFDRVMKGADHFSAAEKRGFELFLTEHDPAKGLFGADCFHCHGGALFTNQRFINNGLPALGNDRGRETVTHDAADRGRFKTPSLRNVAVTAPYMHDGRIATLEGVVEHYNQGVQRSATLDPNLAKHPAQGLNLSAADKAALVAFLHTLTEVALVKR
jgi:cytochrome c peroxidase